MPWTCKCGEIVVSRSKFLLHIGLCKKDVNLKNIDSRESIPVVDNLKLRSQGDCVLGLPVTEEPLCDLLHSFGEEYTVDNPKKSDSRECIPVVDNLNQRGQGDCSSGLPVIEEPLCDLIHFGEEYIVDGDNNVTTTHAEEPTDQISSLERPSVDISGVDQLISDTLFDIPEDWLDDEELDDSDADPNWSPTDEQPRKCKLLNLQLPKRRKIVKEIEFEEDSNASDDSDERSFTTENVSHAVPIATGNGDNIEVPPGTGQVDTNVNNISASSKNKRKKGVRSREVEKRKKDQGLAYKTRTGNIKPAISFQPVQACCKKNRCYTNVKPEIQKEIFNNFYSLPVNVRDQTLCERMTILGTKSSAPGRGKSKETHHRVVTVSYSLIVDGKKVGVCKSMFMGVYGVTRGKVDVLVEKLRAAPYGFINTDMRGRKEPVNKTDEGEINGIHQFIDMYPRHESHYARRDNSSEKIFLPSHLSVKKMYKEYLDMRVVNGHKKSVCYDIFRKVFNTKGYKFKQPYIDTCKTCDGFNVSKRHALNKSDRDLIDDSHKAHVLEAQEGYDRKREDKAAAKETEYQRVLVFDLQQVLPVPYLTTNIVYYKRVLSMYNLTIRDCSRNESSECYMWSELQGGRGSEQIGSCILKKILVLPDSVEQIITYSDTCGGQNRNINIAVMFMYALSQKDTLQVIDQKFLLPGHTRLECDSDHARIERAKKCLASSSSSRNDGEKLRIMVPRDWCQFVRFLHGKKSFKVVEMLLNDFKAFSALLKTVLVHRTIDTNKNPVNWHNIKWLRYTKEFGIVYFKYDLNPFSPFRTLNLIRDRKGRKVSLASLQVPNSYSREQGINPKKKKDLLSMLDLIDKDCHGFYKKLPTSAQAREFDELDDEEESEGGDDD